MDLTGESKGVRARKNMYVCSRARARVCSHVCMFMCGRENVRMYVPLCVCLRACVCVCVIETVRMCATVCVCLCVCGR